MECEHYLWCKWGWRHVAGTRRLGYPVAGVGGRGGGTGALLGICMMGDVDNANTTTCHDIIVVGEHVASTSSGLAPDARCTLYTPRHAALQTWLLNVCESCAVGASDVYDVMLYSLASL